MQLKSKFRKEYNRSKLGVHCAEKLTKLSKQLLAAKKWAKEAFLKSIINKERKCWSDFYRYVKRRKVNKENFPTMKDCNGRIITGTLEKANRFNYY